METPGMLKNLSHDNILSYSMFKKNYFAIQSVIGNILTIYSQINLRNQIDEGFSNDMYMTCYIYIYVVAIGKTPVVTY